MTFGKQTVGSEVNEVGKVLIDMKQAVMGAMEFYTETLTGILFGGCRDPQTQKTARSKQEVRNRKLRMG